MQSYLEWRDDSQGDDRRDDERVDIETPVVINGEETHEATMTNISAGGIFVAVDAPLPEDELVEIEFSIPDTDRRLRVLGEVRWFEADPPEDAQPGAGIEFINLGSEGLDLVREFVEGNVCT